MGLVVIFYVVMGGFQAVIKTDLFQYFLIIFLLLIVSLVIFGKSKVINPSDLNILGSNIGNSAVFYSKIISKSWKI
jgi:Na+/proline symporter